MCAIRSSIVVVLAAPAFAGAGCCDDDSDTPSASDYRDAGNSVCRSVDAEISDILGGGQPTAEVVQTDLATRLATALERLGKRARQISPTQRVWPRSLT